MTYIGRMLHWFLTLYVRWGYGKQCEEKDAEVTLRGFDGRCPTCWAYDVLDEMKDVLCA